MKRNPFLVAAVFAAGAAAGWLAGHRGESAATLATDTVTVTDTVIVNHPVERVRTVVSYVDRRVAVAPVDSPACATDTVTARLPVEERVYEGAGWRAVVSGIEPRLDTLEWRRELMRVTNTVGPAAAKSSPRWGVSLTAGVGVTPRGVQPMVGIGVSYRLFSF